MDLLLENFHFLVMIGLALAAWLKNRGQSKEEEEAERQVREEMVRQLQELDKRPTDRRAQRSTPPPVPHNWDTRPQSPDQSGPKPPPLREIFKEMMGQSESPPIPQPQTSSSAYDEESAPWDFQHEDASYTEITDTPGPEDAVLERQRKMQERLAELKAQAAEYKGQVAGARETQRRASGSIRNHVAVLPPIAEVLKDRSQTRRAVILNEILNKPLGLRGVN
ncbi:MAG: hypothetical protein ACPGIA_00930 [Luteolibacter sp.]